MGRQTRSMRGEEVNFDLIGIKQQIASAPPSQDVKARQTFIDNKLKRRLKKAKLAKPVIPVVVDEVEVEKQMPTTESIEAKVAIDDAVTDPTAVSEELEVESASKKRRTKQRAR